MTRSNKKKAPASRKMVAIAFDTFERIKAVKTDKRWSTKVTVDEVFKDYIDRHQIPDRRAVTA